MFDVHVQKRPGPGIGMFPTTGPYNFNVFGNTYIVVDGEMLYCPMSCWFYLQGPLFNKICCLDTCALALGYVTLENNFHVVLGLVSVGQLATE